MLFFETLLTDATIDLTNPAYAAHAAVVGPFCSPSIFITMILQGIMALAALLVLLELIIGGLNWINSGGEKGKLESARQKITGAIIGIIVLASTVAIFNVLQRILGFDLHLATNLWDTLKCLLGK